jgi:hypothetical protein
MRICIIGDQSDLASVYLGWQARQKAVEVVELPEATLGEDWTFGFDDFEPGSGWVEQAGKRHPLSAFDGAFIRFNPTPLIPKGLKLTAAQEFSLISERRCGLQYLTDNLPCPVANRPSAGRSNGSKPYQMAVLERAGLHVPKWLASNDPKAVVDFAQLFSDGLIYKACSGLRSRVRFLDEQLTARLDRGTTPVVLQEYIPGRDVRIHTVGSAAFATQVDGGNGVDYRFESQGTCYTATKAPERIEKGCVQVAQAEGLLIAGFDFRVTHDQQWFCLEVNPVPSFLPYEIASGQPIAAALLDILCQPRTTSPE